MLIHDVEQNSPEWYALRAGVPTASEFGRLVTGTGKESSQLEGYAKTLAVEVITGKTNSFNGNKWTDRGHELEDEARQAYSFLTGREVTLVGFVTDDDKWYGCSPDSLVGDDRLLEIKCLKPENHLEALMRYKKNGSFDPKYMPQIQGQLLVTERKVVDLFFYHPDMPEVVVSIERDQRFIDLLKKQIETVIKRRDEIVKAVRS